MNDKEFEEFKKKMKKEKARMKKLMEKLSNEIFKQNPKLEGISITAITPSGKGEEEKRVSGFYIENKKFTEDKEGEK